jgi:hypothetical protein
MRACLRLFIPTSRTSSRTLSNDVVARLRVHGAELVGELVQYDSSYRLCYVPGTEAPSSRSPRRTADNQLSARTGQPVRWELDKDEKSVAVYVKGPLIVDDVELLIPAAIDGVGLAFVSESHAVPEVAAGQLVRVPEQCCSPLEGFFLYYPSRRHLLLRGKVDAATLAAFRALGQGRWRAVRSWFGFENGDRLESVLYDRRDLERSNPRIISPSTTYEESEGLVDQTGIEPVTS